jgi:hypothetical protein
MSKQPSHPTASAEIIKLPISQKERRRAEDKFGVPVMKFGYTLLPNLLLQTQGRLGITPVQLNVLVQLIQHWWDADNDPFLAKETIARRMGKSPRMIQRYLTDLEEAGFVARKPRFKGHKAQTSNAYDLDGLVQKLAAIEPVFAKEAEQKRLRQKKIESRVASAT